MKIELKFSCEPKPVQSVRATKAGHMYQPKETVDWKTFLRFSAAQSLPEGFQLFTGPVAVTAKFAYLPSKSWPKKKLAALMGGAKMYKPTRPDLQDNLFKGLADALTGLVWKDDSQIVKVESEKFFAMQQGITITVEEIPE